jgi:hypothetical protein
VTPDTLELLLDLYRHLDLVAEAAKGLDTVE